MQVNMPKKIRVRGIICDPREKGRKTRAVTRKHVQRLRGKLVVTPYQLLYEEKKTHQRGLNCKYVFKHTYSVVSQRLHSSLNNKQPLYTRSRRNENTKLFLSRRCDATIHWHTRAHMISHLFFDSSGRIFWHSDSCIFMYLIFANTHDLARAHRRYSKD